MWDFLKQNFAVRGWQRLLYVLIFAMLAWQLSRFWGNWKNPCGCASVFYVIHAPIHEVGHTIVGLLCNSQNAIVMAGSVFQILTPVFVMGYFAWHKDYPAIFLGLGWLGFAIAETGIYMYDANIGQLNLVTPFMDASDLEGDFTILFRNWNCLDHGCRIGEITVCLGYAFVIAAMAMIILMLILGYMAPIPQKQIN